MHPISSLLAVAIALLIPRNSAFGQLTAFAGYDISICSNSEFQLGGNPTASGGTPPYSYCWSAEYSYSQKTYYASSFIDDTTAANPRITEWIADTITIYLEVTDDLEEKAYDTITVTFSSFIFCLVACVDNIDQGDSTKLFECVSGGIPPLTYYWEPVESLSDPHISSPWAKPDTTTEYTLLIVDAIGCWATSRCFIDVTPVGTESHAVFDPKFCIYPNPAVQSREIYIENEASLDCSFELYDAKGSLIICMQLSEQINRLDTEVLSTGIYIYKILTKDSIIQSGQLIIR